VYPIAREEFITTLYSGMPTHEQRWVYVAMYSPNRWMYNTEANDIEQQMLTQNSNCWQMTSHSYG
jgi:hypothetical protein